MKKPIKVTVTGAAGQIAYALLFRIASGEMFGNDQPIILQLLELPVPGPDIAAKLRPIQMELDDCAAPMMYELLLDTDRERGFGDADYIILVGAKPRSKGMERKDLIVVNGESFAEQGRAINDYASKNVRVLVVGNPANTNALIASHNAPDLAPSQFSCLMRLDHNRAVSMLAEHAKVHANDVSRLTVWGNHSTTQFPDVAHTRISGKPATDFADKQWLDSTFIPSVQKRGATVIEARGMSSAASASNAAVGQMHDWVGNGGTAKDSWTSMGIHSAGNPYGIDNDLFYAFPAQCDGSGECTIVDGLSINDFQREHMEATMRELIEERDAVKHLTK